MRAMVTSPKKDISIIGRRFNLIIPTIYFFAVLSLYCSSLKAQSISSYTENLRDTAMVCYDNGQFYKAIGLYTESVELLEHSYNEDSSFRHLKRIALCYYKRGLCYRAIDKHEIAVLDFYNCEAYWKEYNAITSPGSRIDKNFQISTYFMASSMFELGDYKASITELDSFLSYRDYSGFAYTLRGQAKLKLDDFQGAIKDFDSAIANGADDKGFLTYLKALAKLKSNAFDVDEACSDFWEAYNDYGYTEAKSMFSTVCID